MDSVCTTSSEGPAQAVLRAAGARCLPVFASVLVFGVKDVILAHSSLDSSPLAWLLPSWLLPKTLMLTVLVNHSVISATLAFLIGIMPQLTTHILVSGGSMYILLPYWHAIRKADPVTQIWLLQHCVEPCNLALIADALRNPDL